jgi:hypothetical protein
MAMILFFNFFDLFFISNTKVILSKKCKELFEEVYFLEW